MAKKIDMNAGDYVKLRLAKKEVEGSVLESYDKNVVLLKLKSGYNIGIARENVLDFQVLGKHEEHKEEYVIPERKGKRVIGLIVTGGTIASKLDSRTGGVKPLTEVSEFAKYYPSLFEGYHVKSIEIPFMVLSENMNGRHLVEIAKSVREMLEDEEIEGVVVTHGTDFLGYTSAALSFMLMNLNKPVVFTYSQRSIDRASSDAEMNLMCAAAMACSDCAEVVLVGHASMNDDFCHAILGTKARKMHTSRRDTFKAINSGPIAKVWPDRVEFIRERRPRNLGKVEVDAKFSDKVALVKFYIGQNPDILEHYKRKGYKGIVIEVSGLGHVNDSWHAGLRKLVKSGMTVCAAPQTLHGRLNPKVYSSGRELEKTGVIFLEDMLPETALMKLSWVLGHRQWRTKEKAREKMLENFAGELNELLTE